MNIRFRKSQEFIDQLNDHQQLNSDYATMQLIC
jgi:hypothetical protein